MRDGRIPSAENGGWHPEGEELFEYVTEGVSPKGLRVERHVIEGCERCERRLDGIRRMEEGRKAYLVFDAHFRDLPDEQALAEERRAFYAPLRGGGRGEPPMDRLWRLSSDGRELAERIVSALSESTEAARCAILGMEDDRARGFGYVYACQQAISEVAKDPARYLVLSDLLLEAAQGLPYASHKGRIQPVSSEQLEGEAALLASHALNWLERPKEAREAISRARRAFTAAGEDSFATALCDYYEGSAATFSGELYDAMRLLKRALVEFSAYGQANWSGRADAALGIVFSRKGREKLALRHYEAALSSLSADEESSPYTSTLFNSAYSLVRLGRLDEAKTRYARSLFLVRRHGLSSMLYPIRGGLAVVELRKGSYTRALGLFERLSSDAKAAGLATRQIAAELYTAECLGRMGRQIEMQSRIDNLRGVAGAPAEMSACLLDLFSQLDKGELTAGQVAHVAAYVEDVQRGAVTPYRPLKLVASR